MKRILACLFLTLAAATPASTQNNADFVLGFADCEPAVFVKLMAPVTVKMRNISYASSGRLVGFRQEVLSPAGKSLTATVKVDEEKWNGTCNSLVYTAEGGENRQISPPYESFEAKHTVGMIAFSSTDPGGVILGGGPLEADFTTQFKYDDSNRRLLDTQVFQLRGTSYAVTFSEYNHGPVQLGKHEVKRLLGYTASVTIKQ